MTETMETTPNNSTSASKSAKVKKKRPLWLRIVLWTVVVVVALAILVPAALYIPFVQNWVKGIATSQVSKATGWDVTLDRIMLRFPIDITLSGLAIVDHGDTLIAADEIKADVELLPLFRLKAVVSSASLDEAYYKMDSEDGSMLLTARIGLCSIDDVVIDLSDNVVTVPNALLSKGAISLDYYPDKVVTEEEDTTDSAPWKINIESISLADVDYRMSMMPLIDNLDTHITAATLADADIDMATYAIHARYLAIDSVDVAYYTPSLAYLAENPVVEDTLAVEEEATEAWTITADSLRLTRSHAIYAVAGEEPVEGFDMNYIEVGDINVAIDNFYNCGTCITVPLTNLSATERSGLRLAAHGTVAMDSVEMRADDLELNTTDSHIALTAHVDNAMLTDSVGGGFGINALADISISEVAAIYPDLQTMLPEGIAGRRLTAEILADGTLQQINLTTASLAVTDLLTLAADGVVTDVTDTDKMGCDLALYGTVGELNFLKPALLEDPATQDMINLTPMTIEGQMTAYRGIYSGDMAVTLNSGQTVVDAYWDGNATDYELAFTADSLIISDILPTMGIGLLTAHGTVAGHGVDPYDTSTRVNAAIEIDDIVYNSKPLSHITLDAQLAECRFDANLTSDNKLCGLTAVATGTLADGVYTFDIDADIDGIDLYALDLSETACNGRLDVKATGAVDLNAADYDITASIANLGWTLDENYYYADLIDFSFKADTTSLAAKMENGDFSIDFNAECGLDTLIGGFIKCADIALEQVEKLEINMDTIQSPLPHFTCKIEMGTANIAQQFLNSSDLSHQGLKCKIVRDSTLYMYGHIDEIEAGTVKLDTVFMLVTEYQKRIGYRAHIGNREGTMQGVAAMELMGSILGNTVTALFTQTDFEGEEGFRLGLRAALSDTTVKVSMFPEQPTIAYKQWTVNEDNEVGFNYLTKHFDANLTLSYDQSSLSLLSAANNDENFNQPTVGVVDTTNTEGRRPPRRPRVQEDITLLIKNVQLADWLAMSPLAPPVQAVLDTDIKLKYNGDNVWGAGRVQLDSVIFNKQRVGDFDLKAFIDLNANGGTEARVGLDIDGRECVRLDGSLKDSTAVEPFKLALKLNQFPLAIANAFLPKNVAEIQGYLDGDMNVTGSLLSPVLDGYMRCDSTYFAMPIFGTSIELPDDKIPVDSSVIKFDQYAIKGMNENPLTINGYVNTIDLTDQYIDLNIAGRNVQFVNAKQTKKSQLFGNGYANLETSVKGYTSDLDIKADLTLLAASNITYVLQEDVTTLVEAEEGMVKFVEFNDTSYVLADSLQTIESATNVNLNANISIQSGATVNVFVTQNGSDRAEIKPSGDLAFAYTRLGDMTLNGMLKLESGFVRYSPPVISQVNFTINSDSYIRWTGDVLNPTLNLSASETHRASVSSESSSVKSADFIISIYVTQTLSNMDVTFDLDTNDDITIQNEISSMSASQRSDQAIRVLTFNTYTGSDSEALGSLASTALYSFLTAELNDWAAKTMKGVDVTFGVDQYSTLDGDETSTETTYSYQVSKSLFDDRFKIVVGGSYTPSSTSEESVASDLFNDVSLEYMLNESGSMYVRLFNKSGYFNLLEGRVTQTGVGFVYKRKLYKLKDIFRFRRRKAPVAEATPAEETSTETTTETTTSTATETTEL